MLRISEKEGGTKDGRFQEGKDNITGTKVTAEWLNSIQNEIANVIEDRNIVLEAGDEYQLKKAILDIYQYGVKPLNFPISDNISVPTELPIEPFDRLKIKAVFFNGLSVRHTTLADTTFFTSHVAVFNPFTKAWVLKTHYDQDLIKIEQLNSSGNPGLKLGPGPHLLSISSVGKLQYQTSHLEGEHHQGSLTLSHFRYIRGS